MNARVIILLCLFWPGLLFGQGFAGLGGDADGFALPQPNSILQFPADHGPHVDFKIEWWYLTANLTDADGMEYGVQWTLFRTARRPENPVGWQNPQLWMGHAAVTTQDQHFATERLARGGIGQAGVTSDTSGFKAWIDEWTLAGSADLSRLQMRANGVDFAYDLKLNSDFPLVLHGDRGYSQKSGQGQASYYYSQPRFSVSGVLTLPKGKVAVTGQAWMDREWSSQPLDGNQTGWDWFSLSFDDGTQLMAFQLRQGRDAIYNSATWIDTDGSAIPFANGAFQAVPLGTDRIAGRDLPMSWQLILPEKGIDVTVNALNKAAWMDMSVPYWEGPVRITGSHRGRGYLEMTGYQREN